jgi:hypothetical protein
MTTDEIMQASEGALEAWVVIATGIDGAQRQVVRHLSPDQARTMVDRLEMMRVAEQHTQ